MWVWRRVVRAVLGGGSGQPPISLGVGITVVLVGDLRDIVVRNFLVAVCLSENPLSKKYIEAKIEKISQQWWHKNTQ